MAVRLLYLIFRHVMGTAGPQRTIKECRDSRVAARGRCVTPPGMQTATVLGRPGSVCGTDPVVVPSLPRASDRHPGHDRAVAPRPGDATLDPASRPPKRRPAHPTGAAPVGAAAGRREPLLGLPADPGRTCRAWLPGCGQYGVVDSPAAGIDPPRAATGQHGGNSCGRRPGAFSPPTSSASTPCCSSGCTCCSCAPRGAVVVSGWR